MLQGTSVRLCPKVCSFCHQIPRAAWPHQARALGSALRPCAPVLRPFQPAAGLCFEKAAVVKYFGDENMCMQARKSTEWP
eukprot:scaffold304059_cov21-Tisochrysis_lutea.AAC.2